MSCRDGAAGRCVVVGCHSWVPAAPFGAVCARTCDLLLVSRLMYAVGTLCEVNLSLSLYSYAYCLYASDKSEEESELVRAKEAAPDEG